MKSFFIVILIIPFISIGQTINIIDDQGKKQGSWYKYYNNGNIKYKGQFKDDVPQGLFFYYYNSGELRTSL